MTVFISLISIPQPRISYLTDRYDDDQPPYSPHLLSRHIHLFSAASASYFFVMQKMLEAVRFSVFITLHEDVIM